MKAITAALCALALSGCGNDCDEVALYDAIKADVQKQLRSPASAVFQDLDAIERMFLSDNNVCHLSLGAHVDSQNGFGAMLRTGFMGNAKRQDDGKIEVSTVLIP